MSRTRPLRILALITALLLIGAACAEDERPVIVTGDNPETAARDILGTAESAGLDTLAAAIEAAGLTETLQGDGPFTVFAPNEAAFADLPDGLVALLVDEETDLLADLLLAHVAEGVHTSVELLDTGGVDSIGGSRITVETVEVPATDDEGEPTSTVEIGGQAELASADTIATNGIVHVIDTVLVPDELADRVNEAVDSIPEIVDIVSTLEEEGNFTTLLELVQTPGLDPAILGALTSEGPITVFAPTDAAFALLPEDKIQQLLDEPELLAAVLGFHVVPREVLATTVSTERYFTTAEGQGARMISLGADEYTFAGVPLTETDIIATNGVVHVVGEVLIPESAQGPGGL